MYLIFKLLDLKTSVKKTWVYALTAMAEKLKVKLVLELEELKLKARTEQMEAQIAFSTREIKIL